MFATSYAAVDRELPALLAKHRPDALLMFGLAPRARWLRIETQARNTVSLLPDASGAALQRRTIVPGAPATLHDCQLRRARCSGAARAPGFPPCCRAMPAVISAITCAGARRKPPTAKNGPRQAAFIHVPLIRPRRGRARSRVSDDLARAGTQALAMIAAAARR